MNGCHPQVGVNAVSWEGATGSGDGDAPRRFVTAGCDKTLKVWKLDTATSEWKQDGVSLTDGGHTDWVRDVAWAPSLGMPGSTIASCSQDHRVIVWKESASESDRKWTAKWVEKFNAPVWRVSWSLTGNILAVSCADNSVTLWKESAGGHGYEKLSDVAAAAVALGQAQ